MDSRRLFIPIVFLVATVTLVTVLIVNNGLISWGLAPSGEGVLSGHKDRRLLVQTVSVGASEQVDGAKDQPDSHGEYRDHSDLKSHPKKHKRKDPRSKPHNSHIDLPPTAVQEDPDNHEANELFFNTNVVHNRLPLTVNLGESDRTSTKSSPSTTLAVTPSSQPTLASFYPSKELFVRAIYFDDRPRDRHKNSSVFLVVAKKNITDKKLIVGCQVGSHIAKNFEAKLIGETPLWRAFYNNINHEEVLVDCYDLPIVNGSMGYIMYKTSENSKVEIAASERPLVIPSPRVPPTSEQGKKYNMSIVACAKIFNRPPWMKEWLQYQKTIGIDHVHLDAEDTFVKNGETRQPHITDAVNEGYLSIDIWNKYLSPTELWYHNQGLIYEDCAYRFRGTYNYMVLVDTDDFFTPRTPGEPTLHYYIDKYCRDKNTGSCKFKWVEFFPDYYHLTNASDADGNVTRRLANYSHYLQGNPKSLHRGNVVVDAATHYASKMIDGYRTREVSMNVAYFAHIRHGKNPPAVGKGLRVGIPHSNACMDHIIDRVLIVLMVLLACMVCMVWKT